METNEKDLKRFWAKVQRGSPDECWEWTAHRKRDGYGQFRLNGKQEMAHRAAWILTHGPIPDGMHVLHNCDNQPCVNPDHLRLGTHADNMKDIILKGRRDGKDKGWVYERSGTGQPKGQSHPNAKLTRRQVVRIRRVFSTGQYSYADLARRYGVSGNTISDIVNGKAWSHVE